MIADVSANVNRGSGKKHEKKPPYSSLYGGSGV